MCHFKDLFSLTYLFICGSTILYGRFNEIMCFSFDHDISVSCSGKKKEVARYIYSRLLVGGTNTVQVIDTNPAEREKIFIGLESILKISLIYSLTLENPLHSLVIARRCRQHGNIMLSFSGDKGKRALLTGGIWILWKASQTSADLYPSQGWDKTCYINWVERKTENEIKKGRRKRKTENRVIIKDFFLAPTWQRLWQTHTKAKMSPSVKIAPQEMPLLLW